MPPFGPHGTIWYMSSQFYCKTETCYGMCSKEVTVCLYYGHIYTPRVNHNVIICFNAVSLLPRKGEGEAIRMFRGLGDMSVAFLVPPEHK